MSPRITTAELTAKRRGTPLPRPEREVQGAVLAYLRTVPGVVAWRTNTGAVKDGTRFVRFGFKGISDVIGWKKRECPCDGTCGYCCDGRPIQAVFLAIEIKRPGAHPTSHQLSFLDAVRKSGGIAIVATCAEDVRKVLQP